MAPVRGVSGVLGAPPDWLIAGERDQQFEVAGDSKIISWRFVERVLRSSSGSGGKRLV